MKAAGRHRGRAEHEPAGSSLGERACESFLKTLACESFLKTLKREEINARPYRTIEELEQQLEEFIEQIYNSGSSPLSLGLPISG